MKMEVDRFSDGRLKVLKIYHKTDTNVRINESEVSVCPRIAEVKLEKEVLEAINLWNLVKVIPELREEIDKDLKALLGKGLEALLDL